MMVNFFHIPFLFNTSFKNLSLLFMGYLIFRENPESGKGICLLSKWNKEIVFKDRFSAVLEAAKEVWSGFKIRILVWGAGIGIVCAVIYAMNAGLPAAIIVPKELCDYTDTPSIYLEEELDREFDNIEVLGYKDGNTEMLPFEGNLVKLEYIRGILVFGFYGGSIGGMFITGGITAANLCRRKQ